MRPLAIKVTSVILSFLSVVTIPAGVASAQSEHPNEHRIVPSLDFAVVRDLEVSEIGNRVIVAGDDKVQILRLDDLSPVATVDAIYGAQDLRLQGESVFVAGSSVGVVTELNMEDGQIVHQWSVEEAGLSSIDVTAEHVYFSFDPRISVSGIGRIRRDTGVVEHISLPGSTRREALVRVNPADPSEIFIGRRRVSPMSIYRYSLEGLSATLLAQTPHGPTGSNLRAFEVSQDGEKVWSASGSPYRLMEMDGLTLGVSSVTYEGSSYPVDVSAERSEDQLIVMANKGGSSGSIWLFERGVTTARNKVDYSGEIFGTAVTSTEFFAVLDTGGGLGLHAWTLDFYEVEHPVTVFADGHGYSQNGGTSFTIQCGSFNQRIGINYGSTTSVTIPAGLRDCRLSHAPSGVLANRILVRTGASWAVNEATQVRFDPAVQDAIALFDYLPSPASDIGLFVNQSFEDVTDNAPNGTEHQASVESIAAGRVTPANFVVNLMDDSASYTQSRAPIARLYRAYFLRDPDATGIAYWVGISESSASLIEISDLFASAREFQLLYGSLDDSQFLDLVYQNVMGRSPDQAGFDYWLGLMDSGLTRGEVMMYFSESLEFGNNQNGRIFIDYAVQTLGRTTPTVEDHEALLTVYQQGGRQAVVESILGSVGYFQRFWIQRETGLVGLQIGLTDAWRATDCEDCRPVLEQVPGTSVLVE